MKLLGAGLFTISLLAQEPFQVELDLRHRFVVGDRGDVYRSIVNLGEGVRVFGFNLHYEGKDSIDAEALPLLVHVSACSASSCGANVQVMVSRKVDFDGNPDDLSQRGF